VALASNGNRSRRTSNVQRLATGLGCFSIGLGLAAPQTHRKMAAPGTAETNR
jgi:hypothetical protein